MLGLRFRKLLSVRAPIRVLLFTVLVVGMDVAVGNADQKGVIVLPEPKRKGTVSVEEAIASRRTRRDFSPQGLSVEELAQLLWAAQGITGPHGHLRAAPSGGALYPLDLYAVVGKDSVETIPTGVYHYLPSAHALEQVASGDHRKAIAQASLRQMWMADAPVCLVITAEYSRIERKYGRRGRRYAVIEAGHVGQNIFLQAEGLGLVAGIVGAFDDTRLARALSLPGAQEQPLIVMPVGHPARLK